MSSRYQKGFTIPDGFPQILKSFTREVRRVAVARGRTPVASGAAARPPPPTRSGNFSRRCEPSRVADRAAFPVSRVPSSPPPAARAPQILRSQPDNIYQFGAEYFEGKIAANAEEHARRERAANDPEVNEAPSERGGDDAPAASAGVFDMSDEELNEFVMAQFMRYDADQNGYLDRNEFKAVLADAELGLTKKEARRVMQEADENDDGVLEYREFVPVMVEIIHGMQARARAAEVREVQAAEARESVQMHLLHGMPRDELEDMMRNVFEAADADGSGALDRKEFARCLRSAELGLTRKEINLLLTEADESGDGLVSYEEFTPLCFNILVERFKDDVLADINMEDADSLAHLLSQEFEQREAEKDGREGDDARDVLKQLSEDMLGLSRLQLSAVMAEAEVREDEDTGERMVAYQPFASVAANIIYSMVDSSKQALRVEAVSKISAASGARKLMESATLDPDAIKAYIKTAFEAADANGDGVLDQKEVTAVLRSLGSGELQLKPNEINAMVAAVDADDDGMVEYGELADFLFDVLMHLEREAYIQEVAFAAGAGEEEEQEEDA